jgi:hypothetical protein
MSDKQLTKYLEACALGNEPREEVLSKLLADTDEYIYLKLTDDVIRLQGDLKQEPEVEKEFQRLITDDTSISAFKKGIKIRKLLFDLSKTEDPAERKKLCKQLNKMTANQRFTHKRPKIAEGMATDTGDRTKLESVYTSKLSPETEDILGSDKTVPEHILFSIKSGYLLDRNLDEALKLMVDKNPGSFTNVLSRLPNLSPIKNLTKLIVTWIKKYPSGDMQTLFKRLPLADLEALGKEYKDLRDLGVHYVNELYNKLYPDQPSVNSMKDVSTVKKIYNFALSTKINAAFPGLSRLILRVLLDLLAKDNQTNAEFFEDFIKNPSSEDEIFSKKLLAKRIQDYNGYAFVNESGISTAELIAKHLRILIRQGVDVKKYADYFNSAFLAKVVAEQKLKAGEKLDKILETFTKEELDCINQEKYIVFAEKPREGDCSKITVEIKNISKVCVKVFEINTANYCRELERNVEDDVRLDGLVSISEMTYHYTQASIVAHTEVFELDSLAGKKRGVFIVDLVGDGTTSRAIIRKGMLNVVMKKSRTGYTAKVVDEDYNVCKGEGTGLYFQKKFYAADEDGAIRIEFAGSSNYNLILQHENFCYVVNQYLDYESCSITGTWLFSEETFIPGNKCSMALRLNMFVSNERVPISNIKSAELTAVFTKANDIKTTQNVGAIPLKEGEDYEFSFYLPNGTKTIELNVVCTYQTLSSASASSTVSHSITLLDRSGQQNKTHVFLRNDGGKYALLHLGKNGEPIANTEARIRLRHIWRGATEDSTLVTNAEGKIELGALEGVVGVGVEVDEAAGEKLNTYFVLADDAASYSLPNVRVQEGESLQLPVLAQFEQKGHEASLYRLTATGSVVEDCTAKVFKRNGFFVVDGLVPGQYSFRYNKAPNSVSIQVLEAGRYLNDELLFSKGRVFECKEKLLTVSNIVGEQVILKDGVPEALELSLDRHAANTRVHVFSQTFLPEGENKSAQLNNLNAQRSLYEAVKAPVAVKPPKISYLEDRQLPGEMLYAMNRKNNEAAIGTTSEKPCLFIRRQEVRDTQYASEHVHNGDDYRREESEGSVGNDFDDDDYNYGRKPRYQAKRKGGRKAARSYGGSCLQMADDYGSHVSVSTNVSSIYQNQFDKLRHFLKSPSTALLNLKPDATGKVRVPLRDVAGKSLRVVVVNDVACTGKTVAVPAAGGVELSDLRLAKPNDAAKMFAYERDVYKVLAGTQTAVPGFSSCEFELVDSVAKLMQVKAQLSASQLGANWDFLKTWSTLKLAQKLEAVNEMFSYELAVFLFKRDRGLFDVTLRDLIKCKVNKGVLDHYLLGDAAAVAGYLQSAQAGSLNALEKVCVIDLLGSSHAEQAGHLLQSLQGEDAANLYEDSMAFKTIFDKIVNLGDARQSNFKLQKRADKPAAELFDDGDQSDSSADDDEVDDEESCEEECEAIRPAYNRNRDRAARRERFECEREEKRQYICEEEAPCEVDLFGGDDECYDDFQQQEICQEQCEQIAYIPDRVQRRVQQQAAIRRPIPRGRRSSGCSEDSGDHEGGDEEGGDEEQSGSDSGPALPKNKKEKQYYNYMNFKTKRQDVTVTRLQQASLKVTKEYREMGYYFQARSSEKTYKIESNLFWIDLAKHLLTNKDKPFISENFIYVESVHIPFVVAFMDLNHTAPVQNFTTEGSETQLTLTGGNALLFLKHLKERDAVVDSTNTVLAAQKWFDKEERFEYNLETAQNEEKAIDFFLTGRVYGSQVVVTNVSSVQQKVQVITEVPQGAIPLIKNDFHQSLDLKLNQFSTHTFEFYFYFPQKGDFTYCPACVTREGRKVQIQSSALNLKVLDEPPKKTELKNIKDILAQGSKEDILAFMRKENITNTKVFNFGDVYWLLRDEQFYVEALKILREKLIFNPVVWSYSMLHGDVATLFELLALAPEESTLGLDLHYFNSEHAANSLVLKGFRFLEYQPIFNARFHQLASEGTAILNRQFGETYLRFLKYLFEKRHLVNAEDRLVLTYYLLLQDRIDEAFAVYSGINAADAQPFALQFDYMGAYFDLFKGMPEFAKAKAICERYFDFPVVSWRTMFIEIANQLAEVAGETAEAKPAAAVEASTGDQEVLRATLVEADVHLEFGNVSAARLELFQVDLEVLFSLYAFRSDEFDKLVFSQPHHSELVPLQKSASLQVHKYALPEPFRSRNVLVKVTTATGACKTLLVYSFSSLAVLVSADQGRLKVTRKGAEAGLSRVYVKVFAQTSSGQTAFYRDGYTDAAGGFNYFDVKTGSISGLTRFALFVDHRELGCTMLNVDAPKGEVKIQQKAQLVSKAMKSKQKEMMKKRYVSSKNACEEEMMDLD